MERTNLAKKKKYKSRWKYYYWIMVVSIFIALVFMVRFVLNSSKVFVDRSTAINPYFIEWGLERDGSLRINEPYFLKTNCPLISETQDSSQIDTAFHEKTIRVLRELEKPYLIWKHAESDTVHVLKNNVQFKFRLETD